MKVFILIFVLLLCSKINLIGQIVLKKSNISAANGTLSSGNYSTIIEIGGSIVGEIKDSSNEFKTTIGFFPIENNLAPTILNFDPKTGEHGTPVTITGTNFSTTLTDNIVKFNGITATITGNPTSTSISTTVPTGATSGKITVEVGGQIATSSEEFTVTAPTAPIEIINEVFPVTYNKGSSLTPSITLNDVSSISEVNFKTRGISELDNAISTTSVSSDGKTFQVTLNPSELQDEIGQYYYFEIIDNQATPNTLNSNVGRSFVKYTSSDNQIPTLSFGDQVSNYQIIAIPIDLDDKKVSSVFSALMPYDKTMWRLFDYANGNNREYSGFSTISVGKGYWLIVRNSATINPGSGTSAKVNQTGAIQLTLAAGWNLIGNPYNFRISWDDVLDANGNPSNIGELNTFSGGTLTTSTTLDRYRGGFVFNSGSSTTIDIPATRNTSLGGRKGTKEPNARLGDSQWELALNLTDGELNNLLGGIGMHPNATVTGKDNYDQVSVPMIEGMGFFELAFDHPEYKAKFNKEIVPTQEQYTWEMEVIRDNDQALTLHWQNEALGDSEYQLYLMDMSTLRTINMKEENKMAVGKDTKKLKIVYGKPEYTEEQINSLTPFLGEPYPNPATDYVTIPFKVPSREGGSTVSLTIYDNTGKVVSHYSDYYKEGTYHLDWKFDHRGMYIIQLQMDGIKKSNKIIIR